MQVILVPDLYESPNRWQSVITTFAESNIPARVFTYDPPRTDDLSDIVTDLNEHLIDETYVIGYGVGGRVAIQLASRNPHHLAGTMLISTPAMSAPGVGSFFMKVWRIVTAPIRVIIPYYFRKKAMEALHQLRPGDPKMKFYRTITAPPMETFFGKITDPVVLLWGSEDKKTRPAVAEVIAETMANLDVQHDLQFVAGGGDALHVHNSSVVVNTALGAMNRS